MKDEIADAHRETAKKIKTVFETIDADRSGELDMQEFKDAMEMMGSEMDDEAIDVRDHKLLGLSVPLARGEPGDTQSATLVSPTLAVPR